MSSFQERQKIVEKAINNVSCTEELNLIDTTNSSDVVDDQSVPVDYKVLYFEREKELELLREELKLC